MLERKLYMAGLGGNRYEISIENLKKMAYDAKIKKTDLVIVVETSDDGAAQEKTFRCDQIKGLAELFDQGERDREAARVQDEREREAARELKEQEKSQRREELLREQELRYRQKLAQNKLNIKERREQLKQEDRRQGRTALKQVKKIIDNIVCFISFLAFCPLVMNIWMEEHYTPIGKIIYTVVIIALITLVGFCLYKLLMFPVYLIQYHAETIKKAILVASGKDEYSDDEYDEI